MKLGPLEFTAEDFQEYFKDAAVDPILCLGMAMRANKLLSERLEKAHQVFGIKDPCELLMVFCAQPREGDSHVARLVCIEPCPKVQGQ